MLGTAASADSRDYSDGVPTTARECFSSSPLAPVVLPHTPSYHVLWSDCSAASMAELLKLSRETLIIDF
jgi:hypothetical protein